MKTVLKSKMGPQHYCMEIDPGSKISEVKQDFSRPFPFLKIEFFRIVSGQPARYSKDNMISWDEITGNLQKKKRAGKIVFTGETPVSEIEQEFLKRFGLYVQVFRKSGNIWLETTSTDDWSLEQQNEEGKSLARHFKTERENPEDHDMY